MWFIQIDQPIKENEGIRIIQFNSQETLQPLKSTQINADLVVMF